MRQRHLICKLGSIPEGRGIAVEVGSLSLAIFYEKGEYFAVENVCPHAGAPIEEGYSENCIVTCPWHGMRFSLRTGQGVGLRDAESLTTFPVEIDGDQVFVQIVPGN